VRSSRRRSLKRPHRVTRPAPGRRERRPRRATPTRSSRGHSSAGTLLAAVAAAKELPQLSLLDALELTILVARKDPRRHPRPAARWLLRYLAEHPDATIEEAGVVASCLAALPGASYGEDVKTLRAMAERATSRRRARGVA
jgi:hypothetical protein